MKLLVLAAFVVAVSSGRLGSESNSADQQWPWQNGKVYKYDVESHTLASLPDSASTGSSYRARFVIRAREFGKLDARLENAVHALVHKKLRQHNQISDEEENDYQPLSKLEKPFEINVNGGRIVSLNLPLGLPLAYENLLKGLIGSLQIDLSTYRNINSPGDNYDNDAKQGLFRKMETDVTGDCETLYSVSPSAAEWRREVPKFANAEDPIEVTKSKSYDNCHHRIDYHFGVPEGVEWTGTTHSTKKEQLIKRSTVSHYLVGKNGPIYKAETTSIVNVSPLMFSKQKAEVHSKITIQLANYEDDNEPEWEKPEGGREIENLLYSLTPKQVSIDDSSSSSESRDNEQPASRVRRSSKSKSITINKIISQKYSRENSDSTSSSSSADSRSTFVNDDVPKFNEPAYAALYMNSQPRGDKKQNPSNAQKLVQEMAQQLQNANNMPRADFLSKFNILVRVIASMSYGQLTQVSRNIEAAKDHEDEMKADMWRIYRDAVAQAGTLPAFQLIRSWIQENKIRGEEAAEVVAVLPRSLRYPTKEAMIQFFELAMSPEVREEKSLNTSALIAATKFIQMGQVDNRTVHRYYPTHMYGRLSNQHDRFVIDDILPRLEAQLQLAIEQNDSHKAQVYIRAIGTLGHREILRVFSPYLEGKVPVSTYLRTQVIDALKTLAREKDRYVRSALYSILRNTAEPYEVRVAAIMNIFMTHPTEAMWQEMAEMTKRDPSQEVRAAIKSGIQSAAKLQHPRYFEVARSAQGVRDMLTEENFGNQQSLKAMSSYGRDDDDVGIFGVWSAIGAEDSLIPKSIRYYLQNTVAGWKEETTASIALSNWQDLMNYFNEFNQKDSQQSKSKTEHKYSADKIYDMFNGKKERQAAALSMFVDLMNQQRFFALGEEDLKQLPQQLANVLNGDSKKHYTKVVNKNKLSIMFPVASGMPFIYKYKEPTVIHTRRSGMVNLAGNENSNTNLNMEYVITYAENHDGSVGFLDTISNQYASVGVVGKMQLYAPLRIQAEKKSGEIKITFAPIQPEQDINIFHYSVWPYSANQKKDTLVTISQDPTTKLTNRNSKTMAVDYKFGQMFGTQYQFNGYSYSNDYNNVINMLLSRSPLSHMVAPFNQKDIGQTHFNLKYLGKQSKSKAMTITAKYDTLYNQKQQGKMSVEAAETTDTSPNSAQRREALVKQVVSGVNTACAQVLDLSAIFDSPQKLEYVFTSAISSSDIDPKIQVAVFGARNSEQNGNSQVNAVARLTKPNSASTLNYVKALKDEMKMQFEADIRYGQKERISIQGSGQRSSKYVEDLQNHPLSRQCLEEMASNNNYQHACHKMLNLAHAPDSFRFSVTYNVNSGIRNSAYQAYRIAKSLALSQVEDNPQKVSPDGQLELAFDLAYLTQTMNMSSNSRYGELRIKNIPMPAVTPGALSAYRPMSPTERVLNYYTKHQYQPYCSIESTRVRTFSDRRYNYTLSRNWHVVMVNRVPYNDDYTVLARRPSEDTQEVYISYRSQNGKHLEIEVGPGADSSNYNVKVFTNSKKISEGELTTYFDESEEAPILEYYVQPDNVLVLKIKDNRLRIMYDGQRLVVLSAQGRGQNRGICGQMSGKRRDDYMTPYGLVDNPDQYAASFALNDDNPEPRTRQLQAEAKQMAYQRQNKYTSILRSDPNWQKSQSENMKWDDSGVYNARSYSKKKLPCKMQKQVQYYENYGEICITTKALPVCQPYCNVEDYKVQAAQVVCHPKMDPQFITYRNQIRQGLNPKVSGAPESRQYRVPASCKA
ncbi:unnamed protein product [Pieris brassicae]|uniref:Vitellogenin n=1 Tax=Pieris brassicae TaxID=7116 RepID=A0A9P0XIS8_PIEBR|nr:unnamed protein product [Pieris brassicae]